jgi:hypothetical protein
MTARAVIKAPPLPPGFSGDVSLIDYHEDVVANGTGLSISTVRQISQTADGIVVDASVTAPPNASGFASIHDPAHDKSIFKARYTIRWRARALPGSEVPAPDILLAPQVAGTTTQFPLTVYNRGPDILTVTGIDVVQAHAGLFSVAGTGTPLPPRSKTTLQGSLFTPTRLPGLFGQLPPYHVEAEVRVRTNDPVGAPVVFFVSGDALPESLASMVRLEPPQLDFGEVPLNQGVELAAKLVNDSDDDVVIESIVFDLHAPPGQFQAYTRQPGTGIIVDAHDYLNVYGFFLPTTSLFARARVELSLRRGSIASPDRATLVLTLKGKGKWTS